MGAESPTPSAAADTGRAWAPHGRLLTASLVALNIFLVLLVYFYFWRFFTRRRGEGEDAASSEASSPPASPKARDRREVERAITALPVFVHSASSSGGDDGSEVAAAECAICIAEFADGEEGRLLPRCGHRFHARCVDTWFRFHTTCPLCRASVLLHDAPPDANQHSSEADADCPPV